MNILIIGNGGREHALAWKAAQSPRAETVFVAPGNAGTALEPGLENVPIDAGDTGSLLQFALENQVGLTIVGPEVPLAAGLVDHFSAAGLPCFGPTAAAARLEGSKAFAKDFMARHGIPTAAYGVFSDIESAARFIRDTGAPIVVKADGLAAGKGVIIARTVAEAEQAVHDMLAGNRFGNAGHRVVIEEFLEGEEASFICICDGRRALAMATSQDHKAVGDGDSGPNTGGMGAYSPAPVVNRDMHRKVVREVIEPTVAGMSADGAPFTGFLYAGLMISPAGGIKVLEFNVRFGDPETQPVLMRLDSDLVELCLAAIAGELDQHEPAWDPRAALGVVLAAGGYPGSYDSGEIINGLDSRFPDHVKIFHAGTAMKDGNVVTAGGRVLCVTALGKTVGEAQQEAYRAAARIDWQGKYCRRDIGYRAIDRERGSSSVNQP